MEQKKTRVRYVDIFKTVGIVCMVMGHTSMCPSIFARWFTCFYMPMFFWISGYFFHCESLCKFIVYKAKKLLVPYFVFGFLSLAVFYYVQALPGKVSLEPYIKAVLYESSSSSFPISGALWFLQALFWAEVYFAILKKTNSEIVLLIGSIILGVVGTNLGHHITFRLPWSMDSAMVGESFIYIGYLCRKFQNNKIVEKLFALPWYFIIPGLVINYYCASRNSLSMWLNFYYNIPLFYLNAIMGIILCYSVAKKIDYSKLGIVQGLAMVMNFIGFHSIVYLCTNQLVLFVEKLIMRNHYGWPEGRAVYVFFVILLISSLLIMSGMAWVWDVCKKIIKRPLQDLTARSK